MKKPTTEKSETLKPGIIDCTSDLPDGTVLDLADPHIFKILADARKAALERAAKPAKK